MSHSPPDNVTTTTKTELPPWAQEGASDIFNRSMALGRGFMDRERPIPTYEPHDAVAPFTDMQYKGQDIGNQLYNRTSGGMQSVDAANQFAGQAMSGQFANRQVATNPWQDMMVQAGTNQYAGLDNPYLNEQIQRAQGDVVDAYQRGTAADLRRSAMRNGTFGGSGYNETVGYQQDALAKQLGAVASNMRMQDYGQQVGLEESALNRQLDTANKNVDRNTALREAQIGRQEQSYGNAQSLAAQMAGLAPQLAGVDMNVLNTIFGIGEKQQGVDQAIRDWQYKNWQMNAMPELFGLDIMMQGLSGAVGGQGSTSSIMPGGAGGNPYLQAGGAAMLASQLFGR